MGSIRQPAVAGMFYPADPEELGQVVADCLNGAGRGGPAPKALIVPHAGYIYSGPIAASAYVRLEELAGTITRVVLVGPSHRYRLFGLALPDAEAFATPLGVVPVDQAAVERIRQLPQISVLEAAHAEEHSLEVHLPFLQTMLDDFAMVPLVAGEATAEQVAEVLDILWTGPETLVVASSDLSHYHDYDTARRMDAETSAAIEALYGERIGADQACGRVPVSGLLLAASRRGLRVETIDLRNSGDTAGPREQVVGYGAYVFH
ncbi:MAG: AmmeMemoRadiSam system protein B [Alphaproteobacteria bacterium]